MVPITPEEIEENPDRLAEDIQLPSGEHLLFRPLKSSDAQMLGEYFLSLSEETRRRFSPHPFTKEEALKICATIDYRSCVRLVAVSLSGGETQVVAYFILWLVIREYDRERYLARGWNLEEMAACSIAPSVRDSRQNCGLGSRIMEKTLNLAVRLGKRTAILQGGVQATNERAAHFYRKFGFCRVGSFRTSIENYDMALDLKRFAR